MAVPPRPMARPSCRPAVPPPPVAGAPFGYDVLDDDGAGDRVAGVAEPVAGLRVVLAARGDVAAGLRVAVPELCAAGLDAVRAEWLEAAGCPDADVPVLADEEKIAGTVDCGEPVHAARAAETRTIKVAQLSTVTRAFMNPP